VSIVPEGLPEKIAKAMKYGRFGTRSEALARAEHDLEVVLDNREKWLAAFGQKEGAAAWRSAAQTASEQLQRIRLEEQLDPLGDLQKQLSEAPGMKLQGEKLVSAETAPPRRTVLGLRAVDAAKRLQKAEDSMESFKEIARRRYGEDWKPADLDRIGYDEWYRRNTFYEKSLADYQEAMRAEGLGPPKSPQDMSLEETVQWAEKQVADAQQAVPEAVRAMNTSAARANFEKATDAIRDYVEVVKRTRGNFDYQKLPPEMRQQYDRLVQLYEDSKANFNRATRRTGRPGDLPPGTPPLGPQTGFAAGKRPSYGEDYRRGREISYERALRQRRAIERDMSQLTDYYVYLNDGKQNFLEHAMAKGATAEEAARLFAAEMKKVELSVKALQKKIQSLQRTPPESGGLMGGEGLKIASQLGERAARYVPGGGEPEETQTQGARPAGVPRPQPEGEKDTLRKIMLLGGIADTNPLAAMGYALLSEPAVQEGLASQFDLMTRKPTYRGKPLNPPLPGPEEQLRRLEERRGVRRQ